MLKTKKDSGRANSRSDGAAGMTAFKQLHAGLIVLLLILLSGCGPSMKPFVGKGLYGVGKAGDQRFDYALTLGDVKNVKMAILPFDNLSKTQGAGKIMENYALVEFLKYSPIHIIDPGEVASVLSQERIRLATSISKETVSRIGKNLGVRFLMIGVVHEYDMQLATGAGGSGQIPIIAVSLRIIDTDTGDIIWAINAPRRGTDTETVFGIGRIQSTDRLAQKTAEEIAQAFANSIRN